MVHIENFEIGIVMQYSTTVEYCLFNCAKAKQLINAAIFLGDTKMWLNISQQLNDGEERAGVAFSFPTEEIAIQYYNNVLKVFEGWSK